MTPDEILDEAADIILMRGWHQGGYVPAGVDTETCQVCVLWACRTETPAVARYREVSEDESYGPIERGPSDGF